MKVGLLVNLYHDMTLAQVLDKAESVGVEAVEIGAGGWPGKDHCDPAKLLADKEAFKEFENTLKKHPGLALSALSVHGSAADEELLEKAMGHLKDYASSIAAPDIRILGPSPEVIAKVADSYRMIMYLRGTDRAGLIKTRRGMEKYIEINKGFADISVQFNLDS